MAVPKTLILSHVDFQDRRLAPNRLPTARTAAKRIATISKELWKVDNLDSRRFYDHLKLKDLRAESRDAAGK